MNETTPVERSWLFPVYVRLARMQWQMRSPGMALDCARLGKEVANPFNVDEALGISMLLLYVLMQLRMFLFYFVYFSMSRFIITFLFR